MLMFHTLFWGKFGMNNRMGVVLFCVTLLLVAGVLSADGSEINTNSDSDLKYVKPPLLGLRISDEPEFKVDVKKHVTDHYNKIRTVSKDDSIVDLITQIDESIILGYLEGLTSFGPRVTGETACEQAAVYIYNEFESMGLQVRYDNWEYGGYSSSNVEATLLGVDQTSDDIYIICGHYDTVPEAPGADDDGSGVAAVLVAAQLLSQCTFNQTIRFVAFSGEEEGLYGSYMYVQEAYNNNDDIIGVLNADMIGFALDEYQGSQMYVFENEESEWLFDFTVDVNQEYDEHIGLELIHGGWSWGSDHYYFWEYGYDALFYHEYEFNHYYHSPDDTIENMNLTYDKKGTRLIVATLAELSGLSSVNLPPETPSISGQVKGNTGKDYEYTFVTTDPEENSVYYTIDWGDGNDMVYVGPYASGEEFKLTHNWSEKGSYIIKAKAKNTDGAESDWGILKVQMPRTRTSIILRLLEKYPNAFPLLRHILGV